MTLETQPIKQTLLSASALSDRAYEYLGAHFCENGRGCTFRVFAPHAESVSLCGDFNSWDPRVNPMQRVSSSGIWELFVDKELAARCKYKYFLRREGDGRGAFKSDPFGFGAEKRPNAASVVEDLDRYPWRDDGWMAYRKKYFAREKIAEQPIHIYQMDPVWWKRRGDGSLYGYGELASELIPYVKQMGYTHVELLGVTCGFTAEKNIPDALYAPSPALGEPWELMAFVDSMHEAGVGVILRWNPFCFAASEHGLSDFDGAPLYECGAERANVRFFDLEKAEVQSFLVSNALFWAKKYHADGLSIDPRVQKNSEIDSRSSETDFLQLLDTHIAAQCPDVMTVIGKAPKIKISLMGSEFGDVWTEMSERPLCWSLLDQYTHAEMQMFTAKQNHFYLSHPTQENGNDAADRHIGINKD